MIRFESRGSDECLHLFVTTIVIKSNHTKTNRRETFWNRLIFSLAYSISHTPLFFPKNATENEYDTGGWKISWCFIHFAAIDSELTRNYRYRSTVQFVVEANGFRYTELQTHQPSTYLKDKNECSSIAYRAHSMASLHNQQTAVAAAIICRCRHISTQYRPLIKTMHVRHTYLYSFSQYIY